ncbi:MAG: RNA signal recognition particle [Pseudorhodobacter sp. PARRP1]|nr:MAG: RNA signal recognition particle [Pseudorhodobacter sp. PARRP1]
MGYIQGFLIAVPKAKKQAYIDSARASAPIFKEYGALRVVETWSETLPDGKITDFKRAVQATGDEAVVFAWIEWPDQETCAAASDRMQTDPRWSAMPEMPFDAQRMVWGGFAPIFDTADTGWPGAGFASSS